jgi:hypothetical protein
MPVDELNAESGDFVMEMPSVPMREGEERHRAGLELEDQRRKDAMIAELKALLKQDSAAAAQVRIAHGASERRRQVQAKREVERLRKQTYKRGDRWEGPCAPATVVNMNPLSLTLPPGIFQNLTVPPAGKGKAFNMKFKGRSFAASYMTIDTPRLWAAHTGTETDRKSGSDMPSVEYNHITPLGQVHQFHEHFVVGTTDSQEMGGLIVFEGDIHELEPWRLDKNDGCIWVPQKEAVLEGLGDVVYTAQKESLKDYLERMLVMQRGYAERMIAAGHNYATSNSEMARNQLSNYHRLWHNFALEMGYLDAPKSWAVETLRDTPSRNLVRCPMCTTAQEREDQYFCQKCNAPFDVKAAYLAGKVVSQDWLETLEGADLEEVLVEMRRRRANKAKFAVDFEVPAASPAATAEPAQFLDRNGNPLVGAALAAAKLKASE